MEIKQECYKLFWTNPESNFLWNNSCMATYLQSHKPSIKDKQDIHDTAGETKTNT